MSRRRRAFKVTESKHMTVAELVTNLLKLPQDYKIRLLEGTTTLVAEPLEVTSVAIQNTYIDLPCD